MVVNVCGVARLDFTPKDGNPIKGYTVYYTYGAVNVEGMASDKVFISDDMIRQSGLGAGPQAPSKLNLDFNRQGKLVNIEVPKH